MRVVTIIDSTYPVFFYKFHNRDHILVGIEMLRNAKKNDNNKIHPNIQKYTLQYSFISFDRF